MATPAGSTDRMVGVSVIAGCHRLQVLGTAAPLLATAVVDLVASRDRPTQ